MESVSRSSPVKPHFFKPLLPGFHSNIDIPVAFFSKHIEGKTNESNTLVKLRSNASDITWELKLEGRKLTEGWQEFATSHDLRVGDIVVFRHEGNLLFHLTVFGPSCCEIRYDDVIQMSSDSDSVKQQNIASEGSSSENHSVETDSVSKKKQHTAGAGSSSDNHSFVACVTKSNLGKDTLFLPTYFSRANGLMNRKCKIILLNQDGRQWTLFLSNKQNREVYIRSGWRSFCFANRKKVKDSLTFKLVKTGTIPILQLCSSSTTSQDRFLTLTLTPYVFKKCQLRLPGKFVKEHKIEKERMITLVDQYGNKTTTSLKPDDKCGKMRLGKEWKEFLEVNGVKMGESFKLELIMKEEEDTATHLLKFCSKVLI